MDTYIPAYPKSQYKRQRSKVQKITLQSSKVCWVCGITQGLVPHHVFGAANRPLSDKYGLVVWLCVPDHTGNESGRKGVHFNKPLRTKLKRYAQMKFEEVYGKRRFLDEFKVGDYL